MSKLTFPMTIAELIEIERATWPAISARIPAWHPRAEDPPGSGDGSGDGSGAGGDGQGAGDGAGGTGGAGDWTPPTQAEYEAQQKALADLTTAQKTREEADRKAAEEKARADGDHAALVKAAEERAAAAEAERDRIQQDAQADRDRAAAAALATKLNFRDPADALAQLPADALGNQSKVERALKDLSKAKPYLIKDGDLARQRDVTGDRGSDPDVQPIGQGRISRAYASKK